MTKSPILSSAEAEKFLTQADLEMLAQRFKGLGLSAELDESNAPLTFIRGKFISLFDILALLGKV